MAEDNPTIKELTPPIYKIAITGGPCAGKTTSMKVITKYFIEKGFKVFSVFEIPTMVVEAGGMILMSKFNTTERVQFQSNLIQYQIETEEYFTTIAKLSKKPSIILCDRGTVDPAAYVSKEEFQAIMNLKCYTWAYLRDHRYDRVIFLSSAANGAEQFYTLHNNIARSEGLEEAKALDKRTLDVWVGHPYLTVVPNVKGETFEDKLQRAIFAVADTVGLPLKNTFMHKLLLDSSTKWMELKPTDVVTKEEIVTETILVSVEKNISKERVRKRGVDNTYHYDHKQQVKSGENVVHDIRRFITALEYLTLMESRKDPAYNPVTHRRVNFIYNNVTYYIDSHGDEHILYFKSSSQDPSPLVPPFIKIKENVRKNPRFSVLHYASQKPQH